MIEGRDAEAALQLRTAFEATGATVLMDVDEGRAVDWTVERGDFGIEVSVGRLGDIGMAADLVGETLAAWTPPSGRRREVPIYGPGGRLRHVVTFETRS